MVNSKLTVWFNSVVLLFFLTFMALSNTCYAYREQTAENWLIQQSGPAFKKIVTNTSPFDGLKGSVIASPSRNNPNYYYHWVRDAAIAMDSMMIYDQHYATHHEHKQIRQLLFDYLDFSVKIQNEKALSDLGEPRFHVDGSIVGGEWGRPQNDSPALRALSLIHWAKYLIARGEMNLVKEKMYSAVLPAKLPIKKDLEYVSHHWKDPSYDLWEEVKGIHFYTLMVQRRALLEGAGLAMQLNDPGASKWYQKEARAIEQTLQQFYDPTRGCFVATLYRVDGINDKTSGLDSAVLLGLLHGDLHDGFLAWDDPRVQRSISKIIEVFKKIYPINQRQDIPGEALGRYPEDKYNGINSSEGNPWVLCTFALAEAMYRSAITFKQKGQIGLATKARKLADQFVLRVKYHAYQDGSLSEQIDRYTGFMTSASDLTWNYASLISTRLSMEKFNEN